MSHFCLRLWFSLGSRLAAVKLSVCEKRKDHMTVALFNVWKISERRPRWRVEFTKWQRWVLRNKTNELRRCYNGHLEQPHSRAVSISSEYEVPSVQRNTTFLLLLLVMPQQTPVGAAAWQDRGQSMRGILLVDVHVLMAWWRFRCSLTISPWHVSSGR